MLLAKGTPTRQRFPRVNLPFGSAQRPPRGKHNGYVHLKLSNKWYSNFILNPNWKLGYKIIKTLFRFSISIQSGQIECDEMKKPLQRTKVVICQLPPLISQNDLYNWLTFGLFFKFYFNLDFIFLIVISIRRIHKHMKNWRSLRMCLSLLSCWMDMCLLMKRVILLSLLLLLINLNLVRMSLCCFKSQGHFLFGWLDVLLVSRLGAQFKAVVDYAPSQRAPKPCSRKDSREGTIFTGNFFI